MSAVTWVCVTVVIAVAAIGGILSAPRAVAVLAVTFIAQWVAWVAAPPMEVSLAVTFIAQWVFAAATKKVAWTWATAGRAQVVTTCILAFSLLMVVLIVTAPIVEESGDDPAIMVFSTRFSIGAIMSAIVIVLFVPFLVILLPEALVSVMPATQTSRWPPTSSHTLRTLLRPATLRLCVRGLMPEGKSTRWFRRQLR